MTGPFEELSDSELKEQFQTNVFGTISLTQGLLPAFRARGEGCIVNVSTIAAFAGGRGFGAYNRTKALSMEVKGAHTANAYSP